MKVGKILALVFLLSFYSAKAGHEIGGIVITYKSVESVNGNPLEYVVNVYGFYALGGVTPPSNLSIDITSSCYSNSVQNLPRIGSVTPVSNLGYCSNGGSASTGLAIFRDTVILPGTCADFRFSHTGLGGRYFSSTNIDDNYSGSAYFYADLDNTQGSNSSPGVNTSDMIQALCLNNPLSLYGFNNPDGDSLNFSPSAPAKISGSSVVNYPYKSGYSTSNPVGSTVGYSLNSSTGVVQTTLTSQGTYIVTIKYEEYRPDTLTGNPMQIGEGRFIMVLGGISNCNTANFELKHRSVLGADSVECNTQSLKIATSRKLATTTLTSSGSEFNVFTTNGNLNVSSAMALSDTVIEIQLAQPVPMGSLVSVVAKNGSDGDVLLSLCGKEITAFDDTLSFYPKSAGAPSAAFSHSANYLTANFNSGSSVADSVVWDFGDGGATSSAPNPSHTYPSQGQYTVSLIAFNKCGQSDTTVQNIQICDTLQAAFAHSTQGDTIIFDAGATTGAQTYLWDFGDGNTGTGMTTTHIYGSTGQFLVSLTVVNPCGDTAVVTDTLEACPTPVPWWTYQIASTGGSGMTVDFDGTGSQNVTSFQWDFGDGTTNSTSLTPTHTYVTPSLTYFVELSITNACGQTISHGYKLSEIGLEEVRNQNSLEVYPNPVSDKLQISWNSPDMEFDKFVIYRIDGSLVKKQQVTPSDLESGSLQINTSGLSEGVYFLTTGGSDHSIKRKIIISR